MGANEQRTAHVDNWNLWFRIAQCSCITNGNVHASLLGKSSNEGETPACREHVLMHKMLTLQSHPDMQNKTHHMHTQAQGAQKRAERQAFAYCNPDLAVHSICFDSSNFRYF